MTTRNGYMYFRGGPAVFRLTLPQIPGHLGALKALKTALPACTNSTLLLISQPMLLFSVFYIRRIYIRG